MSDKAAEFGYVAENRHTVQSFLAGNRPEENFSEGLLVTEFLMAACMSAEQEKTISFPSPDLESFIPAVTLGGVEPKRT